MEIISVLNLLRRFWALALPGAFLGILAGLSVLYHVSPSSPHLVSRGTTSGTAIGRTLLTSSTAQPFELSNGMDLSETMPNRAAMLADLLATDELRSDIARRAGIAPKDLVVFGPSAAGPVLPVPIGVEATTAAQGAGAPDVVYLTTSDQPALINVRATAPNVAQAAKLVDAVRGSISGYLEARATSKIHVSSAPLGPVQVALLVNEPPKFLGLAAAMMVFILWCGGLIVVFALLPRLVRTRAAAPA
jgi:hypothetical protein